METLSEAIERLERRGFRDVFRARPGGFLELPRQRTLSPESLVVDEIVRFEGQSDPEDQAVLFALRSRDEQIRGTFVTTFGPQTDPDCAAVIQRLGPPRPGSETRRRT